MVDQESKDGRRDDEELDAERVVDAIVRRLEFDVDEIDGADRRRQVEDLHDRVVDGDEVREQVKVAGDEDQGEQDLTATRDTGTRSRLPYLEQEEDNSQQVRQIADKSEYVHGGLLWSIVLFSLAR